MIKSQTTYNVLKGTSRFGFREELRFPDQYEIVKFNDEYVIIDTGADVSIDDLVLFYPEYGIANIFIATIEYSKAGYEKVYKIVWGTDKELFENFDIGWENIYLNESAQAHKGIRELREQ